MGRLLVLLLIIYICKLVVCEWWNLCIDENWFYVIFFVLLLFFICIFYIVFFRYGGGVFGIIKGVMILYGMYNDKVIDEVLKRKKYMGISISYKMMID